MTNREMFEAVIANTITEEVIEKAKEELRKLDERNAKRAEKNAEKRAENKPLKDAIYAFLGAEPKQASEVGAAITKTTEEGEVPIGTAKASAMLRQMLEEDDYADLQVTEIKVPKVGKRQGYFVA